MAVVNPRQIDSVDSYARIVLSQVPFVVLQNLGVQFGSFFQFAFAVVDDGQVADHLHGDRIIVAPFFPSNRVCALEQREGFVDLPFGQVRGGEVDQVRDDPRMIILASFFVSSENVFVEFYGFVKFVLPKITVRQSDATEDRIGMGFSQRFLPNLQRPFVIRFGLCIVSFSVM